MHVCMTAPGTTIRGCAPASMAKDARETAASTEGPMLCALVPFAGWVARLRSPCYSTEWFGRGRSTQ